MLILEDIEARRLEIAASPDLIALQDHLALRARPVIERMPIIPTVKALLSRDGGVCPDDGSPLVFDPWSPLEHRCLACGRTFSGSRHDGHWARAQHLWVAERAAHLTTVFAATGDAAAGQRAREIVAEYAGLYHRLPNRDNVLGPSHLFFSTYLESIWVLHYLAAAFMLRELDALSQDDIERVDAVADEAATIIAEFNEGMSNRQTWNSAALTAIAAWFGDEQLAITAIEGRTGLLGHLADGFGNDGMWYEGENYHLFALRGLLIGLQWSRIAGANLLDDVEAATHLGQALMAPADTSLPDFTFPARKDSRFGVSLAHPAYLECWEAGNAWLGDRNRADLPAWLTTMYQVPPRSELTYDAYLNDAGGPVPSSRSRSDLSWWALWMMAPTLSDSSTTWRGSSRLMRQQGLAIARTSGGYWSLECGGGGGGHGHPDKLQLTAFLDDVYWLPDPGTGSYVARDLFWYRSTLAHNAPLLDSQNQLAGGRARCDGFESAGDWTWATASFDHSQRSLLTGPTWGLDLLHFDASDAHQLDLPWHFAGDIEVISPGTWEALGEATEFVTDVQRFTPAGPGAIHAIARQGGHALHAWFAGDGDLLRAVAPGLPGSGGQRQFLLRRDHGNHAFMVTVIDPLSQVTDVTWSNGEVTVTESAHTTTVQVSNGAARINADGRQVELRGAQPMSLPLTNLMVETPPVASGQALWVDSSPTLDGSLVGFRCSAPLTLDEEYFYFRSEAAYPGRDAFSATAFVNWSDDRLYLAVDVHKQDVVCRDAGAEPLGLDNEPEDINADGIQVYFVTPDHRVHAWLIRPVSDGLLATRPIGAPAAAAETPTGAWQRTPGGYRITVKLPSPAIGSLRRTERLPFDVIVNEMLPGRIRRAGQLIWSGGPGWVYLRGDRQDPAQFGQLELTG